jgi:outer membrane protein TolC
MRRREPALAAVLSAAWLAGCATSALEMAPERPDRPWHPSTMANGEIIAGEKPVAGGERGAGYALPPNAALADVPPPPKVDAGKTWSLPELIDLAESNNPTTRIAWNEARRVALAAGIAESAYLPKLTASEIVAAQGTNTHGSALGQGFNGNESANGTISALSVQWLLFDFGERAAVIEAVKQASVISNIAFTAAHQQVIYAVAVAYYANAAAQARVATAKQSVENARAVQAAAEDRYSHQIGTVIETAQARQATAQANLALVQATGAAQDSYLALISAMGISPLTKIRVADAGGRKLSAAIDAPVERIISESLSRRPDVLSAYAAEKASLANVRAARAEFLPKLFLSATGAYNSGGLNLTAIPSAGQQGSATLNLNGGHLGGTILAGVSVPLYDGGTRAAALEQARTEADSAEARLTHVRDEAVREIVLADNAVHTSLSAYNAAEALRMATQTTFDAALSAYRSGVGTITDATTAETQLLAARNASTDSYSTALSAAAALALATGALGRAPE